MSLSIVIITRNEAHVIAGTLNSVLPVSNDIVVVDNGSTDGTQDIARQLRATVIETGWDGYGANKNKGNAAATNDWIFSLDADEAISETLLQSLLALKPQDPNVVYEVKRKSFFCNKMIRYGEWGGDKTIRLFNRTHTQWNNAPVHESLILDSNTKVIQLKGDLLHYTVSSVTDYLKKTSQYAHLSAEKYFAAGKPTNYLKIYISPLLNFLQHYIFRLGFLDGREGFLIAKTSAKYTHLKYWYLKELNDKKQYPS
jgi:glycosyltransferase involved in cell wall biosynthesis